MSYREKYLKYKKKYQSLKKGQNGEIDKLYFRLPELEETKELFKKPISIELSNTVEKLIDERFNEHDEYVNSGLFGDIVNCVETLYLEVDLLNKFVDDINEDKITDLAKIKEIAKHIGKIKNVDLRDMCHNV